MGIKYKIVQLFGHILEDTLESYNTLSKYSNKKKYKVINFVGTADHWTPMTARPNARAFATQ